ncbi:MAG: hypothetical protein K2P58_12140 [Hyphomonadaceae bacterium]|nr:hypothetical protein [Hyphomonadaceae bacterium]
MVDATESRVTLTLALDLTHWRRHDRAFWAQTLATAANEAAPHVMHVEGYELGDTLMIVRLKSNRPAKVLQRLWRDDDTFLRLRARLADLGARADFEVDEDRS